MLALGELQKRAKPLKNGPRVREGSVIPKCENRNVET